MTSKPRETPHHGRNMQSYRFRHTGSHLGYAGPNSFASVGEERPIPVSNPYSYDVNIGLILWGSTSRDPRLGWQFKVDDNPVRRCQKQTAYQVLVADSEESLHADKGNLWDSGRINSEETIHVVYCGKPLTSRSRCFWKVRVWGPGRQTVSMEPAGHVVHGIARRSRLASSLDCRDRNRKQDESLEARTHVSQGVCCVCADPPSHGIRHGAGVL